MKHLRALTFALLFGLALSMIGCNLENELLNEDDTETSDAVSPSFSEGPQKQENEDIPQRPDKLSYPDNLVVEVYGNDTKTPLSEKDAAYIREDVEIIMVQVLEVYDELYGSIVKKDLDIIRIYMLEPLEYW